MGCSKDKDTTPSDDISHNDSTALLEIYKDISKDYPTMLDLPPIVLPDVIMNLDSEESKQFQDIIKQFNNLIKNPQNADGGSHKSLLAVQFTKNCTTYGQNTECIYKKDRGEYQIKVVNLITPDVYSLQTSYSGIYDGVDFGKDYLLQSYETQRDDKSFWWINFRVPVPPESAGEP